MQNTAMKIEQNNIHVSVLKTEIGQYLRPFGGGLYIDATLGFGGHTLEILQSSGYKAKLVCFEVDTDAIAITSELLSPYSDNITIVNRNFSELNKVLDELGIEKVDGIVADLGLSSYQLEQSGRGFSFQKDEFLDMRADMASDLTAFDLVNEYSAQNLAEIFWKYGEERFSRQIANAIVRKREEGEISTTLQLSEIIENTIPQRFKPKKINCSTKVFQALRVCVNNELDNLSLFLETAIGRLKVGARIAIISFNSLEDKIVKKAFSKYSNPCTCPSDLPVCSCGNKPAIKLINKRAIIPGEAEIRLNPRSRSARLRVAEKIL